MVRRNASLTFRLKPSMGLASRCSCMWARYLCLYTGLISKSSIRDAPPSVTPPGGEEGPSEDAPVDGDFEISMYGTTAGWKIRSWSVSKNAQSYDRLVPTGTGVRPREQLRRGTTCRGERRGERERVKTNAKARANIHSFVRSFIHSINVKTSPNV